MRYCLKVITKDGDVNKYYFSSYEELNNNAYTVSTLIILLKQLD